MMQPARSPSGSHYGGDAYTSLELAEEEVDDHDDCRRAADEEGRRRHRDARKSKTRRGGGGSARRASAPLVSATLGAASDPDEDAKTGRNRHHLMTRLEDEAGDFEEILDFEKALEERWERQRRRKCAAWVVVGAISLAVSLVVASAVYCHFALSCSSSPSPSSSSTTPAGGGDHKNDASTKTNVATATNTLQHYKPMTMMLWEGDHPLTLTNISTAGGAMINSLSMSDNGEVLAVAYSNGSNNPSNIKSDQPSSSAQIWVCDEHDKSRWKVSGVDFSSLSSPSSDSVTTRNNSDNVVAQVRLSGDGTTLLMAMSSGSSSPYFLKPYATIIKSKDQKWRSYDRFNPLQLVEIDVNSTDPSSDFTAVDVAISENGTMCAVGYGASAVTGSTCCVGNDCYTDKEFRNVGTNVLPCDAGSEVDWNGEGIYRFDNTYRSDNYGFSIDMSSDGSRIVQSSEYNARDEYHATNFVFYSSNDGSYYGTTDATRLVNDDVCLQDSQFLSDVAISNDGNTVAVAVQCISKDQRKLIYVVQTFVANRQTDVYSKWMELLDCRMIRNGENDEGASTRSSLPDASDGNWAMTFSVALSGDAKTLVLAISGALEIFEFQADHGSPAWKSLDTIEPKSDDENVDGNLISALFLVALNQDGSRIAVATNILRERNTNSNHPVNNRFAVYERI